MQLRLLFLQVKSAGFLRRFFGKALLRKSCPKSPQIPFQSCLSGVFPTFSAKPQHGPKFWLTRAFMAKEKDRRMLLLRSSPHIFFIPFSWLARILPTVFAPQREFHFAESRFRLYSRHKQIVLVRPYYRIRNTPPAFS